MMYELPEMDEMDEMEGAGLPKGPRPSMLSVPCIRTKQLEQQSLTID